MDGRASPSTVSRRVARRRRAAHHGARLPARPRADRRQGGLRRGRVRRLLGAGRPAARPTGRRAPSGPRSTPAWSRPPPSTARRSSPPRASARRPTCTRCSTRWPCAAGRSAATARRASSAAWRRSTTAPGAAAAPTVAARHARRRARRQRLRPARAERQPVPVHRLPADPRRGVRARRARRRRPARRPARRTPRRRAAPTRLDGRTGDVRPARRPGRGARAARRATRTPRLVAGCDRLGRRGQPPRRAGPPLIVAIDRLPELRELAGRRATSIEIGAALTLTEIERRLAGRVPLLDELFPQFASRLIRNGATLGGNLGTGSPIGDTPPAAARPRGDGRPGLAPTASARSRWRTTSPATAQSVRQPGELIKAVVDPAAARAAHRLPQDRQAPLRRHLQRRRRVRPRRGRRRRPVRARIGLGGVAATPLRALATEAALGGRPWTAETVDAAAERAARPRAPRSTTTAPARPTASAMLGQSLLKALRRDRRAEATA